MIVHEKVTHQIKVDMFILSNCSYKQETYPIYHEQLCVKIKATNRTSTDVSEDKNAILC